MNDLYIFVFLLGALSTFFIYKIVKGVLSIYNYKKGYKMKAKVVDLLWVKTPPARFSYLFLKEQLRITFRFVLENDAYEKSETDIHFKYKKIDFKFLPKLGDEIEVYVTKNENPNKVTINNINKTILPILGLLLMVIFSAGILFLVLKNIN
ncbi:hypothetical protein H3Z83_01520 [Tenacibaculum sp. S7007]|uniref:DUF3592 domain-containing protein n=1 Tax=Tenacibaculum pelagium TaxID=2759527 RepID=A0A839AJH2_9FLAO|nr:hypothetical protein [Tenacibaculum pelagium]MBA6155205.1 hypothetical protein [Tenacibaculum pelagium]